MNPDWLVWLIPIPPLVAFFVILLFTRRSKLLSDILSVGSMAISWVLAWIVLAAAVGAEHLAEHPIAASIAWLPTGAQALYMGAAIDPLGAVMLFFVPLTAGMIFLYSTGYMASGAYYTGAEKDAEGNITRYEKVDASRDKPRFMAFIALFAGAMLMLSVADNLLLLFVGWEIMGLCSYLLIGFWHDRVYPNQPRRITPMMAGIKAFITTRVGDVVMLLGVAYLYSVTGTLNFHEILYSEETLALLAAPSVIGGLTVAELIGLLLFAGTIGKSAQFPLHTWLPDAMEGPTPVSAMIHAATMVSAGVYMAIRMFPLMSLGWEGHHLTAPMTAMAAVGAFTALFAATIALAQRDVKKVLAYSTISQLGYMVAALGIGAYVAAAFHLMTHAIFKGLLFLCSGSVIHAVEHGEEHAHHNGHHFPIDFDAQDMFNMGGLWNRIPVTAWTFLIGGFALSGFPLITAGFWSKDEILADAWAHNPTVFVVLAFAAFLTAFYTARQIGLTFMGQPRTAAAEEASQTDWRMNAPLVVLAVFAIIAGYVGVHEGFPVLGRLLGSNPFHRFVGGALLEHPETLPFSFTPLLISILVALGGLGLGALVYWRGLPEGAEDPLKRVLGPVYTLLENKYYVDEFYDWAFVRPSAWVAEKVVYMFIDRGVIDGFLHTVARAAEWFAFRNKDFDTVVVNRGADRVARTIGDTGQSLRHLQTGRVQQYLAVAVAGVLVLAAVFLWRLFVR
jgi:NADH-quinone oxidoreductase subunit L